MDKSANFSSLEQPDHGAAFHSVGRQELLHFISNDHGLSPDKRRTLMTLLNSPEALENIAAGVVGAAIAKLLADYKNMSPAARTLLSLAGFGVGSMLYKTLHERKFTEYMPESGRIKVKL
jgi:uncharacterized membrane protein YeaQ/YmgE (transglycosylase-associated protein family)